MTLPVKFRRLFPGGPYPLFPGGPSWAQAWAIRVLYLFSLLSYCYYRQEERSLEGNQMAQSQTVNEEDDESFLRQIVQPEEDRRRLHPTTSWMGGYRWFRASNVVCLEQWRRKRVQTSK
jgi:hypothetical protein